MGPSSEEAPVDEMVIFGQTSTEFRDIVKKDSPFETELVIRKIPDFSTSDLLWQWERSIRASRVYQYNPLEPGLETPISVQNEKKLLRAKSKDLIKYLSSRYVHEGEHHRISIDEQQYYIENLLNSFYLPLLYAAGELDAETVSMFAAEAPRQVQNSRLLHEACAVKAQQEFLQQHTAAVDLKETLDQLRYKELLDAYLESGNVTEELEKYVIYAFAQWLMQRVQQRWTFDVEDVAFRFAKSYSFPANWSPTGTVKQPAADLVFMLAAFTDEVSGTTVDQQVSQLETKINEYLHHSPGEYNLAVEAEVSVDDGFSLEERDAIADWYMQEKAMIADRGSQDFLLPLVSREFPSKERIKWPLWTILSNMYLVTEVVKTDDRQEINRSLWCNETVLAWAANTKLLQLAVKLQELRDATYLPLVSAHTVRYQYHLPRILALAERQALPPTEDLWPYRITPPGSTGAKELGAQILADWNPDHYQDLLTDLNVLGRAIRSGNKQQVRAFF